MVHLNEETIMREPSGEGQDDRPGPSGIRAASGERDPGRHGWRNWLLVTAVMFVSSTGLSGAVLILLRERGYTRWPWPHSDALLLVALLVAQLLFIGHLTIQERGVVAMRKRLARAQQDALDHMESHYRRLGDILNVTHSTSASTDPQTVLNLIADTCIGTFHCDQASLMLYDYTTKELEVRAATGHVDVSKVLGGRQKLGYGIAGRVAETREPLILGSSVDASRFRHFERGDDSLHAAMVVPIILRGDLMGVLCISSRTEGTRYDKHDLRALQVLAETAGITVRHAQQSDWMRETIQKLDAALQERDGEGGARAA